jgi:RimJ/RimL family protein N-acetyltransferase
VAWSTLLGEGISLSDSPAESDRFGVSMGRLTVGPGGAERVQELREVLATATQDVVVVRYAAGELALAQAVATCGRDVLPAGALTYWGAPTADVDQPPGAGWDVVSVRHQAGDHGSAAALAAVDEVVAASFEGYGNHYLANPLLSADRALAGYQEWARRSVSHAPDLVLLLVERAGGRVVGVATCDADAVHGDLEVLLAGLVPAAQGRGVYGHLLAGCARLAAGLGLGRTIISTQVHNIRVQRAWARAGLRPFGAVETVHCVRRGLLDGSHDALVAGQPGQRGAT